ncbi:MAG: hypothetical protein JO141_17085 [Bradyrhizobium sp.]|nr:hypothetical protein [Bradyrhizobium sp.]
MSESLTDIVAKRGEQLKALRKQGDHAALLAAAREGADEVERRIVDANGNEEQREPLMAVQRWTYNAAADCWPGWSIPSQPSDPRLLMVARELAQRSEALVERLGLGRQREGTGTWLIGAFDLALGRYKDASHHFAVAREHYLAANAPLSALLAEGYVAIVAQIDKGGVSVDGSALDQVCDRISAGDFKDGAAMIAQLRTALAAFTQSPAARPQGN